MMQDLPSNVYFAMSYEFNTAFSENKEAMTWIKEWIEQQLEGFKLGLSAYYLSDSGNDFLEVAKKLDCNTEDIVDYIHTQMDEILNY